jgi:hypothetical protein
MINCIYLDVDGVLVDCVGGIMRLFGVSPLAAREVSSWDGMPKVLTKYLKKEITDEMLWGRVAEAGEEFWINLEWTPWGEGVLRACLEAAPVMLMTATPGDERCESSCVAGKVKWIRKALGTSEGRYAITTGKHHMAHPGALLIDDGEHNEKAFLKHKGQCLLFPMPWNRHKMWPTANGAVELIKSAIDEAKMA